MGADWSRNEVEAVVADYFLMFAKDLAHQPYSKTEHRRALASLLGARSEGSIEFKHSNVSAVLLDLGYPYIPGYKPRSNYQQLLADVIVERLAANPELGIAIGDSAAAPAEDVLLEDPLALLVPAPARPDREYAREGSPEPRPRFKSSVNYLEREARNMALGLAGEKLALAYEQARLEAAGRPELAVRVQHTSVVDGDGAGFDICSFEVDGSERFVEVKTTAWGKQTPFFVSNNEVAVSKQLDEKYHLYRLFEFRRRPRLFVVAGSLDQSFALDATQYVARIA